MSLCGVAILWSVAAVEWQVAAQEADEKTTEMTKAVDELKKLLKQANHGKTYLDSGLSAV